MRRCRAPCAVWFHSQEGGNSWFSCGQGTVSVSPGSFFLKDPSYYTAIRESKVSLQESTQKLSIHAQKENNNNSFILPSNVLFWKILKSPGFKKSTMNTHLPFTKIGQVLIFCHICAMCVIHMQTHITHSCLTEPLHSWGVICRLDPFILNSSSYITFSHNRSTTIILINMTVDIILFQIQSIFNLLHYPNNILYDQVFIQCY